MCENHKAAAMHEWRVFRLACARLRIDEPTEEHSKATSFTQNGRTIDKKSKKDIIIQILEEIKKNVSESSGVTKRKDDKM